jgi:hypothetical protein
VEAVNRCPLEAAAERRLVDPSVSDVTENGRGVLVYCRTKDGLLFEVSCQRARKTQGS